MKNRDGLRGLSEGVNTADLAQVEPLPHRRVLGKEESGRLRQLQALSEPESEYCQYRTPKEAH